MGEPDDLGAMTPAERARVVRELHGLLKAPGGRQSRPTPASLGPGKATQPPRLTPKPSRER